MMDDTSIVGARLRQMRAARGDMSLRALAGLAGMSKSRLSMIERGETPLDSIREITDLSTALRIAPHDLMRLPYPAPSDGKTDAAVELVRLVFDGIDTDDPAGTLCPTHQLHDRVHHARNLVRACDLDTLATILPTLISDLHTALNTRIDHPKLVELTVFLHVHVTRPWLDDSGAPVDLQRRAVFLARRLAWEHGEVPHLGMTAFSVVDVLASDGAFDMALAELDRTRIPSVTRDTAGLVSALLVIRALLAQVSGDPSGVPELMREATGVTTRFGETGAADPYGFGWGPTDVEFRAARIALEAQEPDRAVRISENIDPRASSFAEHRVYYWMNYGRALAKIPGREGEAVAALRRAELIGPHRVHRDTIVRDAIEILLLNARRRAGGVDLRRLAYLAGVPL